MFELTRLPMHLALVCFFFEADAKELARNAGRAATKLYEVKRGILRPEHRPALSQREKLENTLLRISKLVDPIHISRVVYRMEKEVCNNHYKTLTRKWRDEAKFFSERFLVLNVLAFYGCLKYLLASIS